MNAVIIGSTSGIGRELAQVLLEQGHSVGLSGRRINLLDEIKAKHGDRVFLKRMDLSQSDEAMAALEELIAEMNGVDLVVISSGVGFLNKHLKWAYEKETIGVNVAGFAATANVAMRHFFSKGSGHLVGISSIAAIRGGHAAPAYNASKAFMSNYLEGLRKKAAREKKNIIVTTVEPGYVDTQMAQGDKMFWVASPRKAAEQIYDAIRKRKKHAYVTRRWRLIAWLLKIMPDFIFNKT